MAVKVIPFVFPSIEGVRCAFQCRANATCVEGFSGGNIAYSVNDAPTNVLANRRGLLQTLGITRMTEATQVHGIETLFEPTDVTLALDSAGLPPHPPQADGLATSQPGLALLIKTADCQPVLFAHVSGKHIMALHVGWRGNRQHFIQKAVSAWCLRERLKPQDLFAVRGPSLGPSKAEFIHFDSEWGAAYERYFNRTTRTMNLWRLTRDQLAEAGVQSHRIYDFDLCTASLPLTFFSYRAAPISGRQASVIWRDAKPLQH